MTWPPHHAPVRGSGMWATGGGAVDRNWELWDEILHFELPKSFSAGKIEMLEFLYK